MILLIVIVITCYRTLEELVGMYLVHVELEIGKVHFVGNVSQVLSPHSNSLGILLRKLAEKYFTTEYEIPL